MTDLERLKAMLDRAGNKYRVNDPEFCEPKCDTLVVTANYAAAMFIFDLDGTFLGLEVMS